MTKEAPKKKVIKTTLPEVMGQYDAVFSMRTKTGYAHLKFGVESEMLVTFLNDEGYAHEDGEEIPFADIDRVADFMRKMKELRLPEYESTNKK